MAWIEAHQELRDHPKTKRAARLLGISRPQMIGHLLCLWWWSLDYADDGDLSDFDAADIADAAEWDGDADTFVSALVNCGPADRPGFLVETDGGLSIRDWSQYGGKYITKRNQGRDRQRAWRERNADVTQGNTSSDVSNADVTRYASVSNTPREEEIREEKRTEQPDPVAVAVAAWESLGLTINPFTFQQLTEAVDEWSGAGHPEYVAQAIAEAGRHNARSWAYVEGILRRCRDEGKPPSYTNGKTEKADAPLVPVKYDVVWSDGTTEEVEVMTRA